MSMENVMMAERNKDDQTMLAMVMHGKRFVAVGVTEENAPEFKRTIARIMMAVNIHMEETDDDIAHNTKRAEAFLAGAEYAATLLQKTVGQKEHAMKMARDFLKQRSTPPPRPTQKPN